MMQLTMLLEVLDQFVEVFHVLYNASGTTIFLVEGVLVNALVDYSVGTDV